MFSARPNRRAPLSFLSESGCKGRTFLAVCQNYGVEFVSMQLHGQGGSCCGFFLHASAKVVDRRSRFCGTAQTKGKNLERNLQINVESLNFADVQKLTSLMDYQNVLDEIYTEVRPYRRSGHQADYIPALERVNPDQFGMCLTTVDGHTFQVADSEVRFSIQSISKVYSLALCLSLRGEQLWKRVGKEPSGNAFNSIVQLEYENGIPRNPFINAGALVTADILVSSLEFPEGDFLRFVRALAGDDSIGVNPEVAESEYLTSHLNQSIAHMLKCHGNLENDVDRVLRFYLMMCSVEMNCRQLARSFLPFADHRHSFNYTGHLLTSSLVRRINAVMLTCGFYDEAGEFAYLVGLPGKSGVGGGIAAINPREYAVAVWSPRLNKKGNSVMGMKALEQLTTKTGHSIF